MLKMSTSFYAVSQPHSKTQEDLIVNETCGKFSHIFSIATLSISLASDEAVIQEGELSQIVRASAFVIDSAKFSPHLV